MRDVVCQVEAPLQRVNRIFRIDQPYLSGMNQACVFARVGWLFAQRLAGASEVFKWQGHRPRRYSGSNQSVVLPAARVFQYYLGVPYEPTPLRPLDRRLPERGAELFLRHDQNLFCKRPRILPRDHLPRRERNLRRIPGKLHIPRTNLLGDVPTKPFRNPALERRANSCCSRNLDLGRHGVRSCAMQFRGLHFARSDTIQPPIPEQ